PPRGRNPQGGAATLATVQPAVFAPVQVDDELGGRVILLDRDHAVGFQSQAFPDKRFHAHRLSTSCVRAWRPEQDTRDVRCALVFRPLRHDTFGRRAKKGDQALALMRQAADIEDRSEKNIVTPGRLLPARELLGDTLMELKRPAEALKEYEASQQREPNRYRGLYGSGQAAAQSGNRDKARQHFSKLIELAGSGDLRPETQKARRYLASN